MARAVRWLRLRSRHLGHALQWPQEVDAPARVAAHERALGLWLADTAAPTVSVRSAISDGLVGLLKEYYGRGPDQARTYVAQDLVVCLLRGGFTRVEQTLLAGGHGEDVIRQRMAFQDVMRERFERVVEEATGRQVVGFMSGNQQDPDMICEVFVLAATTSCTDTPAAKFGAT